MNHKLKTKLINALRSGLYNQCFDVLRKDENTFSIEGILCHLISPKGWCRNTKNGEKFYTFEYVRSAKSLAPAELIKDFRITEKELDILSGRRSFEDAAFLLEFHSYNTVFEYFFKSGKVGYFRLLNYTFSLSVLGFLAYLVVPFWLEKLL